MTNLEKSSKRELLTIISQQEEKLSRYETRLRDVVIAYKGLVKEKEALELSVTALSKKDVSPIPSNCNNVLEEAESTESPDELKSSSDHVLKEHENEQNDSLKQLHQQLTTLTNSLATLSAEKSRMEASFQADKKQLRLEKEEREKCIRGLQEKNQQLLNELDSLKTKLTSERHERDKEQNDHGAMIRELQKLLSSERCQVEVLESQCEELKCKLLHIEQQNGISDKKLRDLKNELESTRRKLKRAETDVKNKETPPILLELQEEMANLKLHHQAAISQEQKRVAEAEERARRLAAMHEERVANLEARLAELSETVGSYDKLRQQDQAAILKLKEHIAQLDFEKSNIGSSLQIIAIEKNEEQKENCEIDFDTDVQSLVDQIQALKAKLCKLNQLSEKPIDLNDVFHIHSNISEENLHESCQEQIAKLRGETEVLRKQLSGLNDQEDTSSLVNALKERIHLLNAQMNDGEENKKIIENLQKMLKAERTRSKSELTAVETDYRCRLSLLEQQLQKQRERSLSLLEDKEQEIQMLKSSFGMFLPGGKTSLSNLDEDSYTSDNVEKSHFGWNKNNGAVGDSPHILHYVHEIARRDVEISNLRKVNHKLEGSNRESIRKIRELQDIHEEQENKLKEEVSRLERCQSREGANLEYLKNVVLSFLTSHDSNCKKHMLNAIAAVLKFSAAELERVNKVHKAPIPTPVR